MSFSETTTQSIGAVAFALNVWGNMELTKQTKPRAHYSTVLERLLVAEEANVTDEEFVARLEKAARTVGVESMPALVLARLREKVRAERERCARVCEDGGINGNGYARRIRALGDEE